MDSDPGEQNNLYLEQPQIAAKLLAELTEDVTSGASVAGKKSTNDVNNIKLWK